VSLISVIVLLAVFITGFWLTATYAPNDPPIRMILFIVLAILFVVFILILLGITGPIGNIQIR
jgi:hypothetical protein